MSNCNTRIIQTVGADGVVVSGSYNALTSDLTLNTSIGGVVVVPNVGSSAVHTNITGIDLAATLNPNEFTVSLSWIDEFGVAQVTTDPTPVVISNTGSILVPPASDDAVGSAGIDNSIHANEDHKHAAQGISTDLGNALTLGVGDGLHYYAAGVLGDADGDSGIIATEGGGATGDSLDFTVDGVAVGKVEIIGGVTKWTLDGILDPVIYRPTSKTTAELTTLIAVAANGDLAYNSTLDYYVRFDGAAWVQFVPPGASITAALQPDVTSGTANVNEYVQADTLKVELDKKINILDIQDDDTLATAAADKVGSTESIKAYIDNQTEVDATESVKGIVELATAAETTTGTDAVKAVHPAGLKVELDKKQSATLADGTILLGDGANVATAVTLSGDVTTTNAGVTTVVSATDAIAGKVELATDAEAIAGTDTIRATTPANVKAKIDDVIIDEDTLVSDLDTKVPTQQSVKAYVDNQTTTVVDDLTTGGTTDALSAEQGKLLKDEQDKISSSLGQGATNSDMGVYSGVTITDAQSAKQNIQELEVAFEGIADEITESASALTGFVPTGAKLGIDTSTGLVYYNFGASWKTVPELKTTVLTAFGSGAGRSTPISGPNFPDIGSLHIEKYDDMFIYYQATAQNWTSPLTTRFPFEYLVATGFSGNLATTDDTLQKVADKFDAFVDKDEVIESAGVLSGAAPVNAQYGIDTTTGTGYYVSGGNWVPVPVVTIDLNTTISDETGVNGAAVVVPTSPATATPDIGDTHIEIYDDVNIYFTSTATNWTTPTVVKIPRDILNLADAILATTDDIGSGGVALTAARSDHKHMAQAISGDAEQLITLGSDGLHLVDPDTLVSLDANNILVKGTDLKLYANGLTTVTTDGTALGVTVTGNTADVILLSTDLLNRLSIGLDGGLFLSIADATDALKGLVELATDAETLIGTDTVRAVTPANVRSLEASGADITAGTVNKIVTADKVLDEDTLVSDSDTALATQQSIKAYIDNSRYEATFTTGSWTVGAPNTFLIAAGTHNLGTGFHTVTVIDSLKEIIAIQISLDDVTGDVTLKTTGTTFDGTVIIRK
jgi:hypothetical protein